MGLPTTDWEDDMSFLHKKFPEWDLLLKWDITSIRGYSSKNGDSVHVVFKRKPLPKETAGL